MPLDTLADILPLLGRLGSREALRFDDGYRIRLLTYAQLLALIERFNAVYASAGLRPGDRVALWGRNSPEWVAAFWAAIARRIVVVPVDASSTPRLAVRLVRQAGARLVLHDDTLEADFDLPDLRLDRSQLPAGVPLPETKKVDRDDVVEVVYTSGTTGQPRGVVHRHRNIVSNLNPVALELQRYRWLATPFQPVRILNLLPLSHLFGQALGLFIPPLLGGATVLTTDLKPSLLVEIIRTHRVSVLVGVPRQLQQVTQFLHDRYGSPPAVGGPPLISIPLRWWRNRRQHRLLGWKFWAVVAGGARVDPRLESYWDRLGIAFIQGYGLTEASPVVALNHPFRRRSGSLGEIVPGQEVRIASDGEILVRGDSVVGDYSEGESPVDSQGWLHTGDLGAVDSEGRLYFKGRKKDVIVTSEGLNVYPADVEDVVRSLPGVRDCAVVGVQAAERGEQVQAAIISESEDAINVDILRAEANRRLEPHQRIRRILIWPEPDFPRTSTSKVRRVEIRRALGAGPPEESRRRPLVRRLIAELAGGGHLDPRSHLERDIGLSSLDRIELLSRLELTLQTDIDEVRFADLTTLAELEDLVKGSVQFPGQPAGPRASPPIDPPRWNRRLLVRLLRQSCQSAIFLPLFRHYIPLTVDGLETVGRLQPPFLLAANHNSHLDTVAILAALPTDLRKRVAPAVRQEFFFEPAAERLRRWKLRVLYWMACGLFNAYPLPQRSGGIRRLVRFTGELADNGCCPLIFPEGLRSADGRLLPFQPGVGLLATRLQLPVVPVYLAGLFEVMPQSQRWPSPAAVEVTFGSPLQAQPGESPESFTRRLHTVFEKLEAAGGAVSGLSESGR